MEDVPILGHDSDRRIFQEFAAQYDVPAYVRRALTVQQAFQEVLERCRRQREEWLLMVRTRLGMLRALAGGWEPLRPLLADEEQVKVLLQLEQLVEPRLRCPVTPDPSPRVLRRALRELVESIAHFNRRWQTYLTKVDLTQVNELRDGYNRYYLLEKECALRSSRLARQGFHRLEPATADELASVLPLLPTPQVLA